MAKSLLGGKVKNTTVAKAGPVLPSGSVESVTLNGSILGASAETFEQLFAKMYCAMIVGDANGDTINALKSGINEKTTSGVAGLINAQTAILKEIKEQFKQTAELFKNLSKNLNSNMFPYLSPGMGLPVVVIGGSLETTSSKNNESVKAEKEIAEAELEIILSTQTRRNFETLIKSLAKFSEDKTLEKFDETIKHISDGFGKIAESSEGLKVVSNFFNGLGELNKLDTKKLYSFIYFLEDLNESVKKTKNLPAVAEHIGGFLGKLAETSVEDTIKVNKITEIIPDIFSNLYFASLIIPEFDKKDLQSLSTSIYEPEKTRTLHGIIEGINKIEKIDDAVKTTNGMLNITAKLAVLSMLSFAFKMFKTEPLENAAEWLWLFGGGSESKEWTIVELINAINLNNNLITARENIKLISGLVDDLVKIAKQSKKVKKFSMEGIENAKEFMEQLIDSETKNSLIDMVVDGFDKDKLKTASENLSNIRSVITDTIKAGLMSVLFLPIAPLAILGVYLMAVYAEKNKELAKIVGNDTTKKDVQKASINLGEITKLLLIGTLCLVIGGFIVTKNPGLVLGALAFGAVLGLFILIVLKAVNIGAKDIEKSKQSLNDIAMLVAASGLVLIIGGLIMTAYPALILGSFGFAIALFTFILLTISAIAIGSALIEADALKDLKNVSNFIIVSTFILIIGGLFMTFCSGLIGMSFAFLGVLAIFLFTIIGVIALADLMGQGQRKSVADLHKLIMAATLLMVIGGLLILHAPMLVLASLGFGIVLGIFLFSVVFAISKASKHLDKLQDNVWKLLIVVGASALILLIAGGLIVANPWLAAAIPWFIACVTGLFLALGWVAEKLSKKQAKITKGVIAMGLICVVAMLAVIPIKMLANATKGVDLLHLLGAAGIMALVLVAIGGLSIAAGALITGPQAVLFGAGIAALGAICVVAMLAAKALQMVANTLEVFSKLDVEKIKFGAIVKALGTYIVMIGMMVPIAALSIPVGLASPAIMLASASIMVISKSLKMMAKVPIISGDKIKSSMKAFLGMVAAMAPLGLPFVTITIMKASAAAASLGLAISEISKGVKDMAELKIPVYTGTKLTGYRSLNEKDFKLAADNVAKVVTTLGGAIGDVYKNNKEMFRGGKKNKFYRVCQSVGELGEVISNIAEGVKDFAELKIPVKYNNEGKAISFRPLTNNDFKSATENVKLIVTTLSSALINVYNDNPEMFKKQFKKSKFGKVLEASKQLGKVMSSIASGVVSWANLKMPTKWNEDGKPIKFDPLPSGFHETAANNVKLVITTLFDAMTDVYDKHPEIFKKQFKNSKIGKILKASQQLGNVMTNIAFGVKSWANLKIPTKWNEDGKPIAFDPLPEKFHETAAKNVKTVIKTLFEALSDVYDPELFDNGKKSKVMTVINASKNLGQILSGLGMGIKHFATMSFVEAYDPNTGKPSKIVKITQGEITEAGNSVKSVIEAIFNALIGVYKNNDKMFKEGKDSKIFIVVNSAQKMSKMVSNLANGIKKIATMMVPSEWDKDGKPIKYTKISKTDIEGAGTAIGNIITSIGTAIINLASNPNTAKYFEDGEDSVFAQVIGSIQNMGNVIGGIGEGMQKFAKLQIPVYDKNGKIERYINLNADDFKKVGENIGKIVSSLGKSIVEIYTANPELFESDNEIFKIIVDSCANLGTGISNIADGVQKFANMKVPTYDKDGNFIKDMPLDKNVGKTLTENIGVILTGLGNAIENVYKKNKKLFKPIGNGETVIEKVSVVCQSMSEIVVNIANGLKTFSELKLSPDEQLQIATNVKNICTTLGEALHAVYEEHDDWFDLPSVRQMKAGAKDTLFGRIVNGCATMGQMLTDIGEGLKTYADIKPEFLEKAGENIGKVISCIGNAIFSVYETNADLFKLPSGGLYSTNGANSTNVFEKIVSSVVTLSGSMGSIANVIGYFSTGKFPTSFDKDGNVLSVMDKPMGKTEFDTAKTNIENSLLCLFEAFISVDKKAGRDIKKSGKFLEVLNERIVQVSTIMSTAIDIAQKWAEFKRPTEFDKDGNPIKWEPLKPEMFNETNAAFELIIGGISDLVTDDKFKALKKVKTKTVHKSFGKVINILQLISRRMSEMIVETEKISAIKNDITEASVNKIKDFGSKVNSLSTAISENFFKKGLFGNNKALFNQRDVKKLNKTFESLIEVLNIICSDAPTVSELITKLPDAKTIDTENVKEYLIKFVEINKIVSKQIKLINKSAKNIDELVVKTPIKHILEQLNEIYKVGLDLSINKNFVEVMNSLTMMLSSSLDFIRKVEELIESFDDKQLVDNLHLSLSIINDSVNVISMECSKMVKLINDMLDTKNMSFEKLNSYYNNCLILCGIIDLYNSNIPNVKLKERKLIRINNTIEKIIKHSSAFIQLVKNVPDTSSVKLDKIEKYLETTVNTVEMLNGASRRMPFLRFRTRRLGRINNTIEIIAAYANDLNSRLSGIKVISSQQFNDLAAYIDNIVKINKNLLLLALIPSIDFDTKKLIRTNKVIGVIADCARELSEKLNNSTNIFNLNDEEIITYIDKWININNALTKASLLQKISLTSETSPFKNTMNELKELFDFGTMLAERQDIYGEFDKLIESVDKISNAGNKFDPKNINLFEKQNYELKKFIKSINSIDVEAVDKMSRLLEGFASLGLNVKDLNKLVEAITEDLAVALTKLSKELNGVGKVMANESNRKEKRSKVIQSSVKNISDLVNRELTVIVKNEKSGSTSKGSNDGDVTVDDMPVPGEDKTGGGGGVDTTTIGNYTTR